MRVGSVVRAIRQQRGISQRELARRMETDRSYLRRLEDGRVRWPDTHLRVLIAIAQELGVSLHEILIEAGIYPSSDPETDLRAHHMDRVFRSLPARRQEEMLAIAETLLSLSHPEAENT